MLEFASSGAYERHLAKMCDVYRHKRDVTLAALDERCARYAHWNQPQGGYFLWLSLAETVDPAALAEAARNLGVAYVGGHAFHRDGSGRQQLRLAFSYVNEREIPEAILRLGRAMEEAARNA
jgi:2-aminoadipate transaminase